jgi:hypothetical protein
VIEEPTKLLEVKQSPIKIQMTDNQATSSSSSGAQMLKVDEKSKELIRLFRRSLKRKFNDLYKGKHY